MKISFFAILYVCLQFYGPCFGQSYSLALKKEPFRSAVNKLIDAIGIEITVDPKCYNQPHSITMDVENVSREFLLETFFAKLPFSYAIRKDFLVIDPKDVEVLVVDPNNEPIAYASVVTNVYHYTTTSDSGRCTLKKAACDFVITVTYQNRKVMDSIRGRTFIRIEIPPALTELTRVNVIGNNGYQSIAPERVTGSFTKVDKNLLNRSAAPAFIDRLRGIASGLGFSGQVYPGTNTPVISIRGRSTIHAVPNPLIVLDNFPYIGDPANINPEDIESITVLKDAAATSIWGTTAGNGVIVVSTKRAAFRRKMAISFHAGLQLSSEPDAHYLPFTPSAGYIEMEEFLFNNHYFDQVLETKHGFISKVVELLSKRKDGLITYQEADRQLKQLAAKDVRNDFEKYFYHPGLSQQYSLNISGGDNNSSYYISGGYNRIPNLLKGSWNERMTLSSNFSVQPVSDLIMSLGTYFIFSNNVNPQAAPAVIFPYSELADKDGKPAVLDMDFRQSWKDSLNLFPDWNNKPLEEPGFRKNRINKIDFVINLGAKYSFTKGITAELLYQRQQGTLNQQDVYLQDAYLPRNLYHMYMQADGSHPVPLGGINDWVRGNYSADNFRLITHVHRNLGGKLVMTAITGFDYRKIRKDTTSGRYYGYDEMHPNGISVDFDSTFNMFENIAGQARIPGNNFSYRSRENYMSWYLNAAFTLMSRYTFTISGRLDQSNFFGPGANQKGSPLWSAGAGWNIDQENFYHSSLFTLLRLRTNIGYSGNTDNMASANTTAAIANQASNGLIPIVLQSPANKNLTWERVKMFNIGLDLQTKNGVLDATIEYYQRASKDMLGETSGNPTSGNLIYLANTADMRGSGFDLDLTTKNIDRELKWTTSFLFSHVKDKVTRYDYPRTQSWYFTDPRFLSPREGWPLYAVVAYRWGGLDHNTGDPLGYLNGQTSNDYKKLKEQSADSLVYKGPGTPAYFGSLRNTFRFRNFELSFVITGKFGYYFRRNALNYGALFQNASGDPSYDLRWKKPGDETITSVPSMIFPSNEDRDLFYGASEVLVEKADHIRLQDIRLSYELKRVHFTTRAPASILLYIYASDLGILWKATDARMDPDYLTRMPVTKNITAGIKMSF